MVTSTRLQEMFKGWGVWLAPATETFTWYFGLEIEGYALKIHTKNLAKAKDLMKLKESPGFDLLVNEMSHSMQSQLRLIATNPQVAARTAGTLVHLPAPPVILTPTQKADIKRISKNHSHPGGNDSSETLLGEPVLKPQTPAPKPLTPAPKKPTYKDSELWTEIDNPKTGKGKHTPPVVPTPLAAKNTFVGLIEDDEDEDMDEDEKTTTPVETKEEGKKVNKNTKHTSDVKKQKNKDGKEYSVLMAALQKKRLWGKDTRTVVDAYIRPLVNMSYGCAVDELRMLSSYTNEQIQKHFEDKGYYMKPVVDQEKSKIDTVVEVDLNKVPQIEEKASKETQEDASTETMADTNVDHEEKEKEGGETTTEVDGTPAKDTADEEKLTLMSQPATAHSTPLQTSIKENPPDPGTVLVTHQTPVVNLSTLGPLQKTLETFFTINSTHTPL
jgi:hypothetical protein